MRPPRFAYRRNQPFGEAVRNDVLYLLPDQLVSAVAELFLRLNIHQDDLPCLVHHHHRVRSRLQQASVRASDWSNSVCVSRACRDWVSCLGLSRQFQRLPDRSLCRQFAFRDVRSDGNVLPRFSVHPYERNYSCIHPIDRTILGPVLDFAVPHLTIRDGMVHLLEKLSGVVARVENAVILADQFVFGILTDGAELVVHVGNCALDVSHRHDSMLIQSELLGSFRLRDVVRQRLAAALPLQLDLIDTGVRKCSNATYRFITSALCLRPLLFSLLKWG